MAVSAAVERWCSDCGVSIVDRPRQARRCGECAIRVKTAAKLARRAERLAEDPVFAAAYREYHSARRTAREAAKRTGVKGPAVTLGDLLERDGRVCGICGEPISVVLMYPDPRSASVDHVVPLARGGGHSPENLQPAHLDCNIRKGARVDPGRLVA